MGLRQRWEIIKIIIIIIIIMIIIIIIIMIIIMSNTYMITNPIKICKHKKDVSESGGMHQ